MCKNCKLKKGIEKLLDKHKMWTSDWIALMDDNENLWFCLDKKDDESDDEQNRSDEE